MHTELAFDEADLNGLVDGRIEPSRAAALTDSLAADAEAGARVEAWRRQNDSLRMMFASVLFEPVPVRLLPVAVPRNETPSKVATPSRSGGGRIAGVMATTSVGMALIGFALGALAGVGTDGFGLAPTTPVPAGVQPSAASDLRDVASRAVEAHRTYLTDPSRPVEIAAGEEAKLARWIGHRVGAAVRIPNLSRQGWSFLGGRIVPGRHGPAAFLAYGSGTERLGLTVSRGALPDAGRAMAADDGTPQLGVATWTDGDLGYALTSDRGRDWLERNLAPLRAGIAAQIRPDDGDPASP